jgi:hypothetical protein
MSSFGIYLIGFIVLSVGILMAPAFSASATSGSQ